jgi:cytoskeletal protein CcmA (bactofilin family)
MRFKFLILLIGISVVFISCVTIGNGNIIIDERILSSFEKIKISGSIEVRLHSGTDYRAVVTVDSNINKYIETIVINNELIIRQKPAMRYLSAGGIVDIYCPNISEISKSGSGSFETIDRIIAQTFRMNISGSGKFSGNIECESFFADISGSVRTNVMVNSKETNIEISGSGRFNGNIECDNFFAHISGSANINITGNTEKADIRISSSGKFNGAEFRITNCSANISGSGEINIFVEDSLDGKVSGSGNIKYRGNPRLNLEKTGSGRILNVE